MSNGKVRKRALAIKGSSVGTLRHQLYRQAYKQIKIAMDQGFYLEAITLIESLVSDRLESRLSFRKKSDFSFKTLGDLIREMKKVESDTLLKELVVSRLDKWRISRNQAIHEMVKLADGTMDDWNSRNETLIDVAKKGLATLRAVDKRCKELRKQNL